MTRYASMTGGERVESIRADGRITRDEITGATLPFIGGTLEAWGKVRESSGSAGGNKAFVQTAGFGEVNYLTGDDEARKRAVQEYTNRLSDKFVFPIVKDDGQRFISDEVTEQDARRVQFGESAESVRNEIQTEVQRAGGQSDDRRTTLIIGVALAAVALFAGVLQ